MLCGYIFAFFWKRDKIMRFEGSAGPTKLQLHWVKGVYHVMKITMLTEIERLVLTWEPKLTEESFIP